MHEFQNETTFRNYEYGFTFFFYEEKVCEFRVKQVKGKSNYKESFQEFTPSGIRSRYKGLFDVLSSTKTVSWS